MDGGLVLSLLTTRILQGPFTKIWFTRLVQIFHKQLITLDVPYGKQFNRDSLSLVTELGGVPTFKMMSIYTDSVPPCIPIHKIFVMT